MNRKQQKHDMMITFFLHAKAKKKHKTKLPALINITKWRGYFIAAIQKTFLGMKEKLYRLDFKNTLFNW